MSTLITSSRLLWKEWRELRWFLFIALALFLGLPLIEGFASMRTRGGAFRTDMAAGMVGGLGGLLAIFVAVAATTRDLRDELKVFWQSRPIAPWAWLTIKFCTGLAIVLAVCVLPLLMQIYVGLRASDRWNAMEAVTLLACHTPVVILLYSIAFALGCCIRQATHAAMLAVAAAVVVYFLPMLIPPLAGFSVLNLMSDEAVRLTIAARGPAFVPTVGVVKMDPSYPPFVAAMLGGSIVALMVAWLVIRRDWSVKPDRKFVVWSIGGVALLLFSSIAFAVGTNMNVARQFDLPLSKQRVEQFAIDGTRGVLLMRDDDSDHRRLLVQHRLCSFELTNDGGVRYGPVIASLEKMNSADWFTGDMLFWRPERPDRAYLLAEQSEEVTRKGVTTYELNKLELHTFDLTRTSGDPVIHRLNLKSLLPVQPGARAYQSGDWVFIMGTDRVIVVDLRNADAPTAEAPFDLIDTVTKRGPTFDIFWTSPVEQTDAAGRTTLDIKIPTLPHLSPHERLAAKLALAYSNTRYAFNGNDLLVTADEKGIFSYRLISIDENNAQFELLGRRPFTPLEKVTGCYVWKLTLIGDHLYSNENHLNPVLSRYDLRDRARPRLTGHFAIPQTMNFHTAPLPNGQILVAADRLYVLDEPSGSKSP